MTNNRTASNSPTVGVLALQGAYDAHVQTLTTLGAIPRLIRVPRPNLRPTIDGLIMPGGESTTMLKFLERNQFFDILKSWVRTHPTFGTCAGAILLATHVENPASALACRTRHHRRTQRLWPPGRLRDPHHQTALPGGPLEMVFIRAPRIRLTGPAVETLASRDGFPTLVRSGHLLAATFHPELSHDTRVHQLFLDLIALLSRSRRPPATVASISSRNAACTKTSQTRYPA